MPEDTTHPQLENGTQAQQAQLQILASHLEEARVIESETKVLRKKTERKLRFLLALEKRNTATKKHQREIQIFHGKATKEIVNNDTLLMILEGTITDTRREIEEFAAILLENYTPSIKERKYPN